MIGVLFAITTYSEISNRDWSSENAQLSKAEFLEIYFNLALHRHEQSSLNSFNLISFYPAHSSESAILFIVQTYNDDGHSTAEPHFREEIRKTADGLVGDFQSRFGLPIVKKRWQPQNPKSHLIIKHVRVSDLQDTLAITSDGITSFDPNDFKPLERRVKAAGGVWAW